MLCPYLLGGEKKSLGVTLAFALHLLSPTINDSEIGGELAIVVFPKIAKVAHSSPSFFLQSLIAQ